MQWSGLPSIVVLSFYLDDFLLISPVTTGATQFNGLSHSITFLGIEVDTAMLELRLPQKKILELKSLVGESLGQKSCQKRELQSLVGKLQHACKVVKPGWSFLRHIFELLAGV